MEGLNTRETAVLASLRDLFALSMLEEASALVCGVVWCGEFFSKRVGQNGMRGEYGSFPLGVAWVGVVVGILYAAVDYCFCGCDPSLSVVTHISLCCAADSSA